MSRVVQISDGPFIWRIGAFMADMVEPKVGEPGLVSLAENSLASTVNTIPGKEQDIRPRTFSHFESLRRRSQIFRARSAARTTIYTALLARSLLENLLYSPESVGIAITSTSANSGVAFEFERSGLTEGWDVVDPFAFPNTIPSALSTQVSLTLNLTAFSTVFLDSGLGFFHALEYAVSSLLSKRASLALVMSAEEYGNIQSLACTALGRTFGPSEGSAGLVLGTKAPSDGGWRVSMLGRGSGEISRTDILPSWREAPNVTITSDNLVMYTLEPALALSEELCRHASRFILCAQLGTRCWHLVGFERTW
jgi:hypothetical protein